MQKSIVDTSSDEGETAPARKAYASPELVMYGDISNITRAVGKTGNMDGGGPTSDNKTGTP